MIVDFLNLTARCRAYNKKHGHVAPSRSTESIIIKELREEKRLRIITHRDNRLQAKALKSRIKGQRVRDKLFFGKDTDATPMS